MNLSRSEQREAIHRRTQKRRLRTLAIWLGSAALVILLIGAVWLNRVAASQPADHKVNYDASLVGYDLPLHAVHEMTGPSLASIPYLPQDGPQPKLVISQSFFDFKQIGANEIVEHQFVIANEGNAPLTISRAYTTCACTTADLTASVIPPGGIAVMTLTFDAGVHDVR